MFATDGSDIIFVVDENFIVLEQKSIKNSIGQRVYNINELEYVDGYILANIYMDHKIVKINYSKGLVVKEYDGSEIIKAEKKVNNLRHDEVLNGIAYDELGDAFILTGKDWSQFFLVDL